jgi:hypothetical protein
VGQVHGPTWPCRPRRRTITIGRTTWGAGVVVLLLPCTCGGLKEKSGLAWGLTGGEQRSAAAGLVGGGSKPCRESPAVLLLFRSVFPTASSLQHFPVRRRGRLPPATLGGGKRVVRSSRTGPTQWKERREKGELSGAVWEAGVSGFKYRAAAWARTGVSSARRARHAQGLVQ